MLIKFDFSSKTGILVVKFAFAAANLKIETLRMRRRFARVFENKHKGAEWTKRVWGETSAVLVFRPNPF